MEIDALRPGGPGSAVPRGLPLQMEADASEVIPPKWLHHSWDDGRVHTFYYDVNRWTCNKKKKKLFGYLRTGVLIKWNSRPHGRGILGQGDLCPKDPPSDTTMFRYPYVVTISVNALGPSLVISSHRRLHPATAHSR